MKQRRGKEERPGLHGPAVVAFDQPKAEALKCNGLDLI